MVTHKFKCRICGWAFNCKLPDFVYGCNHIAGFIPAMHIILHHGKELNKENWKDFYKTVTLAVVEMLLGMLLLPIFLLTYPFWWLHEKLF